MAKQKSHNKSKVDSQNRKTPVLAIFWIAAISLTALMFLVNRSSIQDVVERTNLVEVLHRSFINAVRKHKTETRDLESSLLNKVSPLSNDGEMNQEIALQSKSVLSQESLGNTEPESEIHKDAPPITETNAADLAGNFNSGTQPATENIKQRHLFFVTVKNGEEFIVTKSKRTFDYANQPLTKILNQLLAGPDVTELSYGITTAIPPGVVLNRVYVRGNIAYIDVSENFRFNRLGREGIEAQLKQVVFSATQFPNVELVQILIDGQRLNFLDPEGTYIGKPITRSDFQ